MYLLFIPQLLFKHIFSISTSCHVSSNDSMRANDISRRQWSDPPERGREKTGGMFGTTNAPFKQTATNCNRIADVDSTAKDLIFVSFSRCQKTLALAHLLSISPRLSAEEATTPRVYFRSVTYQFRTTEISSRGAKVGDHQSEEKSAGGQKGRALVVYSMWRYSRRHVGTQQCKESTRQSARQPGLNRLARVP